MKYVFFDLSRVFVNSIWKREKNIKLISFEIAFETVEITHSRSEYNFIDLLGDVGGIQYVFEASIGFIFVSFAQFNMIFTAFNYLFKLKEQDALLLFDHETTFQKKSPINVSMQKFDLKKEK